MSWNSCKGLFLVLILAILLPTSVIAFTDQIPWNVRRIGADLVWNTNAGKGITIAIIDTGVVDADYYPHPDINASIANGTSFINWNWWDDPYNHGTFIAGIITAIINDFGLVGVSPNVSIVVAQAVPSYNLPYDFINALYWAKRQGAQIITMSFGIPTNYPAFESACDDLYWNYGILLVAAAGNDGVPIFEYPALYDSVIAVGAVDDNDNRWSGSNYGSKLELVAPGVSINSTVNPRTYPPPGPLYDILESCTSFAVPHVTAAAALVFASKLDPEFDLDQNGRWDSCDVKEKLDQTALNLGASRWDEYYGYGLVNAWQASQSPRGDINSDNIVDIYDIATVASSFGSSLGDANWNALADINIDRTIDIFDVVIIALHFGKES